MKLKPISISLDLFRLILDNRFKNNTSNWIHSCGYLSWYISVFLNCFSETAIISFPSSVAAGYNRTQEAVTQKAMVTIFTE